MKLNLRSSRNIWIISMVIFVIVAVSMLFSTYYINISIKAEEDAQTRRAAYKQLGQNLADASDYLTAEVRYYAITGDIEHLYNYWEEIFETKQREQAIAAFENSDSPEKERILLEQAKKYSDLLVETETYSMKLVLMSEGKTAEDYVYNEKLQEYVNYVMSYETMPEAEMESVESTRKKAIELLYVENYENYKTKIMTPIDDFNSLMNARLDREVEERKQGTRIATIIQIILAIAALFAIGFLLNLMNRLYITPLKSYTRDISNAKEYSDKISKQTMGDISILRAKIIPYGAEELIQFAKAFNQMIDMFFQELRERINAQENMRKARNEAEFANQAKSTFLAQMSHELRTPLNAVNGYTYLLEKTNPTRKQEQYLEGIRYSSNGLLELINQILDFSKIEAGHLELENDLFSLRGLLQEVEAVFTQEAMQKGLKFVIEIEEKVPDFIEGDSLRLRQVLVNLLGNAFKFTAEGSVSLRVNLLDLEETKCLLYFAVMDTGIGIEEEAKEKIFQPFVQSDASVTRKYGGTGLGLPICNEIIMSSGDKSHRIRLESEIGMGSVFSFTMDYVYQEQGTQSEIDIDVKIPHFYGKKVLITDDSEINIKVQSEILSLCGIATVKALSGMQAIALLKEQADIDLVFMDIRMPQMDGYETAKGIRQIAHCRKVPIIALTADAVPEVQRRAKEAGMDGCLLKPVEQEALFRVLTEYLKETDDKIFEQDACLNQLNGRTSTAGEIIDCFLLLHKNDKEKLKKYLQESRFTEAEELVHQLKGIMGNLKCTALYHCCCDLQKELQQCRMDSYKFFEELWDKTVETLSLKQEKFGTQKDISKQKILDPVACVKLQTMCEDCDTEVISLLEEYEEALKNMLTPEDYRKLKESMLKYEFSQIKEYLK